MSDLIEGWLKLMETPAGFTGPVNIGNPNEFTMLEFAKLVLELSGSSSKIEHRKLPQDDPTQRRPDISIARRELGWEPTVQLREGLSRTIAYFKEQAETQTSAM